MEGLRWILLGIGILVVIGVYYLSRREPPVGEQRVEPWLEEDDLAEPVEPVEVVEPEPEEPERIVTLYVKPREGQFSGAAIADAAEKLGLILGGKGIYERPHDGEESDAVFCVANMTEPGTFDDAAQASRGLALFLVLPNPRPALDAWDAMLAAGQRLADVLGGTLADESQSTLVRQRSAQIREQMREYDRQHIG